MKLVAAGARILLSRVGQVLANAAVVMVVAHRLGPEGQGHYSLTVAMAMLAASVLAGGMGLAAVPPLRQGRIAPGRMLRAQLVWCGAMAGILAAVAALTLRPQWSMFLAANLGWTPGLGWLAALAAAGILGFEVFSYDLLARGRLVVGAAVNGVRATGHLVLILALAVTGRLDFPEVVGVFAAAQALGMAAVLVVTVRELARPWSPPAPADAGASRAAPAALADETVPDDLDRRPLCSLLAYNLRRGWLGQISAVAYFLLLRLDQGLLAHFRDAAEVGVYSVAVYVGEMLWLLPGALTPLLVHSSGAGSHDADRDPTAARAVRLGLGLTLAVAVPLFLVARPLLTLLAGGAYAEAGPALRALLPGIVAFAPGAVLAGDFIGRGRPHWNTQASVLTVAVNMAAGLVLIPRHGAVGAAWASSLAYACGSAVMLARFRQATGLSLRALILGRITGRSV